MINRLFLLKESIVTFDQYPPKADLQRAENRLKDFSEAEIIELAKEGDNDAINYIFDRTRRQIAKAFWQYYLGPDKSKWGKIRINRGDAIEYLNMVIEGLKSDDSNPLLTFDHTKYREGDKINKLGYYIYRYAQSWAFKAIRRARGGISGAGDNELEVSSLDAGKKDDKNVTMDIGLPDSGFDDIDIKDAFVKWFKTLKDEKDIKIIKLRLNGVTDMEEIGKIVFPGKSSGKIMAYQRLKKLLNDFKDFAGLY